MNVLGFPNMRPRAAAAAERRIAIVRHAEHLQAMLRSGRIMNAELCARLAISERTLRLAFMAVTGTSPVEHLRSYRLGLARKALLGAPAGNAPVKVAALTHGFLHLGRFAAAYKAHFGEAPSCTVARQAAGAPGATHTVPDRATRREDSNEWSSIPACPP